MFYNMYAVQGRYPRELNKMAKALTFNTTFSYRQRTPEVTAWDLNWEEGTFHARRKLKFGKQTFAGPGRDKRTQRDSLSSRPTTPSPYSLQVSLVIKLILETGP